MENSYSVLIIDDHPLISDAYQSAFEHVSSINSNLFFEINIANNCDSAIKKIKKASSHEGIDIVVLDISLPPSKDGIILSGEDLGIKINKLLPDTKIIISTTYSDHHRVKSILKSVNPDGFLIKSDINREELIRAIQAILNNELYYSKSVLKFFKSQIFNEYVIDKLDRDLLFELSSGTKMKELPKYLPMSLRAIEKRKSRLKEIFDIQDRDDKELIHVARKKGFI